jgi:RNA polymerase sigma factor (sigma-70 family)
MSGEPAADSPAGEPPALEDLLARHRDRLVRWLELHAKGLRRFESSEDLAQGVHLHVLTVAERLEWRGEDAFVGWLLAVARRFVADRAAHWHALKRDAGPTLRITFAGSGSEGGAVPDPGLSRTGPSTWASRREELLRATRVLAAMPPRDAELVRLQARGLSIEDLAQRLSMTPAAAQRARLRAMERFKKLYALAGGAPPA